MEQMQFINDIPRNLAIAAHAGTSFVPERRGDAERESYASEMAADYARLAKHADTPEKQAQLEEEFARYRTGYAARTRLYLSARSRCLSTMITGPSNFNTRRNTKANNSERNKLDELVGFRERALKAIIKKMHPELRPIMAGDGDALERLQEKLDTLESNQEMMVAVNATIRKYAKEGAEAQVAGLIDLGVSRVRAVALLVPDFCKRIGFPSYSLTNNGANIRRLKGRLEALSKTKTQEETETIGEAATVNDCPAENRIRLTFPGKPSEEVRKELKSGGFKWTPSLGVWQAYRNQRTTSLAMKIAQVGARAE